MTRGLFLDFDGTLANSLSGLKDAYIAFLGMFGVSGTDQEFEELNGPPLHEIVRILQVRHQLNAPREDLELLYQQVLETFDNNLDLNAGGVELLDAASAEGYAVAVVTSSPRARVQRFLENWNLSAKVHLVLGAEDSERSKPHPDPYISAIKELAVSTSASFAVEDSRVGAKAALAADLPVVFLGNAGPLVDLPLRGSINALYEAIPFLTQHP